MAKFTFKVDGLKELQKQFNSESFTSHVQGSVNKIVKSFETDWPKAIESEFYTPQTPKRHMKIQPLVRGKVAASIEFKSGSVVLGQFPFQQTRFTTLGQDEKVERKFKKGLTRKRVTRLLKAQVTKVKVRKKKNYFVPLGQIDKRKGWFYNKATMVVPNKLKNNIYARQQKKTWRKGERLPVHSLYGIPVAIMASDAKVLKTLEFDKKLDKLYNLFFKYGQ